MDALVYVKQIRGMQDGQAVFFDIHKYFISARPAADVEQKWQNSHDDGERKPWDWDKYVALHKEQDAFMESLTWNG